MDTPHALLRRHRLRDRIRTAPGLSDLRRVPLGPGLALSVPGAPQGTYVVRVRAVNTVGPGAVSNELTVVVP